MGPGWVHSLLYINLLKFMSKLYFDIFKIGKYKKYSSQQQVEIHQRVNNEKKY